MSGKILGPDGKPLSPELEENLFKLMIDTAVETKVNTAIDHVREDLRVQHHRDSTLAWVRYGALIVINAIIAITLYFIGPEVVRDWTRQFVADNMNRPVLREAADEIMRSRMKQYIDRELVKVETRVKGVTETLESIRKEQEKATERGKLAEKELQVIDETLALARSQLKEINSITQFTQTVLAAQNDDRKAFDQLENWANDAAFPKRKEAAAAYRTVLDAHAQPMFLTGMKVPWNEGVEPETMTFAELRKTYQSAPDWVKPALIEYVWKRDDIPKKQSMGFLVDIVRSDPSLKAVEYAGRFLSAALDAKLKPLAIKPLLRTWEEKKSSIQ